VNFDLRRPCPHCPFRTDVPPYLTGPRCQEIATSLANGAEFPCHKTTVEGDDDGDLVATKDSQMCAGALILMEKAGQPNQMVRVAERLGMYDSASLDMSAPVHGSYVDFIYHHGEPEEDEAEPCGVVDAGCLAPAGYMVGGSVVVETDREPTICCPDCGTYVCDACECFCSAPSCTGEKG
jgi:hypothetical protein